MGRTRDYYVIEERITTRVHCARMCRRKTILQMIELEAVCSVGVVDPTCLVVN